MADRALGNPLGNPLGLARAAGNAWQPERTTYTRIVSGSGVLIPPEGAKLMRVAVIGGGGGAYFGSNSFRSSGSGGGCAATKITNAAVIVYTVGAGGSPSSADSGSIGGTTTADFDGYALSATGGRGYDSSASGAGAPTAGGQGYGGDYNYTGGAGIKIATLNTAASGGGGAAPGGSGGDAVYDPNPVSTSGANFATSPGQLDPVSGWAIRGGDSGCLMRVASGTPYGHVHSGGAGAGARSASYHSGSLNTTLSTAFLMHTPSSDTFGEQGLIRISNSSNTSGANGGGMGGGGGIYAGSQLGSGGSGGMVVEWFY